jgi:hypothetical protein
MRDGHAVFRDATARPIMTQAINNPAAEPRHIVFQGERPLSIAIACQDRPLIFHELRDVAFFSTRRGTGIKDFSVGLGSRSWQGITMLGS